MNAVTLACDNLPKLQQLQRVASVYLFLFLRQNESPTHQNWTSGDYQLAQLLKSDKNHDLIVFVVLPTTIHYFRVFM